MTRVHLTVALFSMAMVGRVATAVGVMVSLAAIVHCGQVVAISDEADGANSVLDSGAGDASMSPEVSSGTSADAHSDAELDASVVADAHADAAIVPPLPILDVVAGDKHSCAHFKDGRVKCWGSNEVGNLGQGHQRPRGFRAGEMGDALAFVDLGTGRTATALSAGWTHT